MVQRASKALKLQQYNIKTKIKIKFIQNSNIGCGQDDGRHRRRGCNFKTLFLYHLNI